MHAGRKTCGYGDTGCMQVGNLRLRGDTGCMQVENLRLRGDTVCTRRTLSRLRRNLAAVGVAVAATGLGLEPLPHRGAQVVLDPFRRRMQVIHG